MADMKTMTVRVADPKDHVDGEPFLVVCVRADEPVAFHDNVYGECGTCQTRVQFRPNIPTPSILICSDCFFAACKDGEEVFVSPTTVLEVDAVRRMN